MLEIPESNTVARQLDELIIGKTINNVEANASPHKFAFYFGEPSEYGALLRGGVVERAEAFGGLIEVSVGKNKLSLGDGVNARYFVPDDDVPVKHQLRIEFTDNSALICTVQMYGRLFAFPDGADTNFYYLVAKEKPSPLTDVFDAQYFEKLLAETKPTASAKAFLATEQRIPGLGNGVLQDILFNARINPRKKLNALSSGDTETLFKCVKDTLREMTAKGGRDTEKDVFGADGGYTTILSNKTLKSPCTVCGGEIVRQAYMGGNVYYCPVCQPV